MEIQDEKDLVATAAKGDKKAFMELYRRYCKMVYRHCYASTLEPETARDLFQEIWLKVYLGIRRIRKIESFAGFLKTIIRNTLIDFFRKSLPHEELNSDLTGPQEDPISLIEAKEILKKADPEDRYLLFLRFYEGYTNKEIASLLELSESAVKMRLHRLLKRLGEKM